VVGKVGKTGATVEVAMETAVVGKVGKTGATVEAPAAAPAVMEAA
jgi:hypothetical protein